MWGTQKHSKAKAELKRKARVVEGEEGRDCKLGKVGGVNASMVSSEGMEMEVTVDDLHSEDQVVVKVATSGIAQCVHGDVRELDVCHRCMPHKRKALEDWCARHKHKARKVVQGKLNGRVALEHGQGRANLALRTKWEDLPSQHKASVTCIVKQWSACPLHPKRLQVYRCALCKRTRDTAQAKWEEMNPSKVAKYVRTVSPHSAMDKYLQKYGVGVVGIT